MTKEQIIKEQITGEQIATYFNDLQNKFLQLKNEDDLILFLKNNGISPVFLYLFKNLDELEPSNKLQYYDIDEFIEKQFKIPTIIETKWGAWIRNITDKTEELIRQELINFLYWLDYEIIKNEVILEGRHIIIDNLMLCSEYDREKISNFGLATHTVIFRFIHFNFYLGITENEYSDGSYNFGEFYKVKSKIKVITVWEKV